MSAQSEHKELIETLNSNAEIHLDVSQEIKDELIRVKILIAQILTELEAQGEKSRTQDPEPVRVI